MYLKVLVLLIYINMRGKRKCLVIKTVNDRLSTEKGNKWQERKGKIRSF